VSLLVSQIVDRARALMHDRKDGHYVREFLNEQANGVNLVFQVRNRNLLQAADGAPSNVAALVNGAAVAIASLDQSAGLVTLTAAPASLAQVEFRYYFEMATDEEWLDFYRLGANFVGDVSTVTALTDSTGFQDAYALPVAQYAAAQASRALASLTHWYYSANAGNKSFNKDQVSRKFMEQADGWEKQAKEGRLAVPERFDQNKAPAFAYTGPARGSRYWEPRR
jgi:hypothetical protein